MRSFFSARFFSQRLGKVPHIEQVRRFLTGAGREREPSENICMINFSALHRCRKDERWKFRSRISTVLLLTAHVACAHHSSLHSLLQPSCGLLIAHVSTWPLRTQVSFTPEVGRSSEPFFLYAGALTSHGIFWFDSKKLIFRCLVGTVVPVLTVTVHVRRFFYASST